MVSSVNSVAEGGRVRQPRGVVKVNGTAMPGWIDWDVENNNHYQSDTFRATFSISKLPPEFGLAWWASQTTITVEILAGFPADPESFTESDLTSWIFGNVDEMDVDPVAGRIHVAGRDLTSLLIDTKTTDNWQDKVSSEIAVLLAQRHGLGVSNITETTTKAGTIYELDQVQMNHERSEWDLLTYLAGRESFAIYVKGHDLHFEPLPDVSSATPYLLQWEEATDDRAAPAFNGSELTFTRNLTIARGIAVVVRSWNAKSKKAFKASWPKEVKTISPGTAGPASRTQTYVFVKPGLTQQQADDFAQAKHRELTRHEMKLRASLPADDLLTTTSVINLAGTGTLFDQTYFPDSIRRRMSLNEGYVMTLAAKNHNTDTETLA